MSSGATFDIPTDPEHCENEFLNTRVHSKINHYFDKLRYFHGFEVKRLWKILSQKFQGTDHLSEFCQLR